MDEDIHSMLGAHGEAIKTLKEEVHLIREATGRIETTLSETKGGVRTLMAVGAVGGAIGATFSKLVAMLKGGV
jgi:hypothetical protein